jgi:hypothetical protein
MKTNDLPNHIFPALHQQADLLVYAIGAATASRRAADTDHTAASYIIIVVPGLMWLG